MKKLTPIYITTPPGRLCLIKPTTYLLGDDLTQRGYYLMVWAPRQRGKSWLMRQIVRRIKAENDAEAEHPFEVAILTMQSAKEIKSDKEILNLLVRNLRVRFKQDFPNLGSWDELINSIFQSIFHTPLDFNIGRVLMLWGKNSSISLPMNSERCTPIE